jgi:hypothetical protein
MNTSNLSTHQSMTNATNRERSRRDTGDGDAEEAAGQREGCVRDICGTEGIAGVLILFWTDFWADFYGNTPFSYVFTVLCALAGVRITLASAGGSACIAIRH